HPNPEREAERGRRYREANPEKVREYARRYREANKEKTREYKRLRYEANPSRALDYWRTRRARKLAQYVEDVDRGEVYARYGGVCGICGRSVAEGKFEEDHIWPLSKG